MGGLLNEPNTFVGHEQEAISERTMAESGWGAPQGRGERMCVARRAQAAQFAANVLPIIRAAGHKSLNAIAGQLNAV